MKGGGKLKLAHSSTSPIFRAKAAHPIAQTHPSSVGRPISSEGMSTACKAHELHLLGSVGLGIVEMDGEQHVLPCIDPWILVAKINPRKRDAARHMFEPDSSWPQT